MGQEQLIGKRKKVCVAIGSARRVEVTVTRRVSLRVSFGGKPRTLYAFGFDHEAGILQRLDHRFYSKTVIAMHLY
jgi:hypothetical protein